ncbi:MAG: class I mannose-6-phosphate isomerase [Phycisphaerales bacterium]|nr:class I mannose-6-phosphate isomerase [Phycisphaerales bacterium]
MPLPPMRFSPILKPKVWGGRTLSGLGKHLPEGEAIGESWELADLPDAIEDGRSRITGGSLDGLTLRDVLTRDAEALLGTTPRSTEGGFPLLLKYLDANDNLSVQVHPDAEWVAAHPEDHLKSEAWFILDAEPGSLIYAGLKPGVDRETFASAIEDGSVVDHLVAIPAVPGECIYLPSGTCHALGAGVLVAEVQTPSDTTFRVWDWGRTGRELHVEPALACIDFSGRPVQQPAPPSDTDGDRRTTCFVDVKHFKIDRVEALSTGMLDVPDLGRPQAFMVLGGNGQLDAEGAVTSLSRGDTVLLPADRMPFTIEMTEPLDLLMVTMHPAS